MLNWHLSETQINWTVWAIGWKTNRFRGWEPDNRWLYLGPFVFIFVHEGT